MLRARRLEERLAQAYKKTNIGGFLLLYLGEEVIAAGVLHAAEPADYVVSTYREYVHVVVRGVPMHAIVAEQFGKRDGCSVACAAQWHLFDAELRFMDGYAMWARLTLSLSARCGRRNPPLAAGEAQG
jgi:pyruvate dehydrogenase E1 component alpha subunit